MIYVLNIILNDIRTIKIFFKKYMCTIVHRSYLLDRIIRFTKILKKKFTVRMSSNYIFKSTLNF